MKWATLRLSEHIWNGNCVVLVNELDRFRTGM